MDVLKERIEAEIDRAVRDGYTNFMFGACYGFDLICAEIVLKVKKKPDAPANLRLIAVIPFEEQAAKWCDDDRENYYNTLALCDEVITLSLRYTRECYTRRNRFMVDNSKRLIIYFDGSPGGTSVITQYAKICGLEIVNLYE